MNNDKLQEIKLLADNAILNGTGHVDLTTYALTWLISQLEQARAENERLKKRLENCMESHTRLELGKQKLRAVYDENYAKAIERQLETERLQEENIRLTEANRKLVEALEWYADKDTYGITDSEELDELTSKARQALAAVKKE